jgi:SpoVK/Ycf46/Vps4 family AAA+-type ATPase
VDQLRAALLRLDLRLRLAVDGMRAEVAQRLQDPFHGLYISEGDVDAMLASTPTAEVALRLLSEPAGQVLPRLERLSRLFLLSGFEQEALMVCLAPELDLRYERLYAYLQDDATRRRPTVELVLRLLGPTLEARVAARRALGPGGTLFKAGILALSDEAAAQWPLLGRPLRVDDRIVEYLLGSDRLDERLVPFTELYPPAGDGDAPGLPDGLIEGLVRLARASRDSGTAGPVIYLQGPTGTAKVATARALCGIAGLPLLVVDLGAMLESDRTTSLLETAIREAMLQGAALAIDGFGRLLAREQELRALRNSLRRLLARCHGITFLLGEARWEPASWLPGANPLRVELQSAGPAARSRLWRKKLESLLPAEEATELAARYRLDGDAIDAVAAAARSRALGRGDGRAVPEDYRAAAKAIAAPPMDDLARRVEPRYGWDDIVLPPDSLAQLHELCERAQHHEMVLEKWGFGRKHARRAGLTGLFVGQPGTGKTMAAEIIAGELGLDLYRIDLSSVVSKYIGETEKNLERIFRAADQGDALLLFDEADALFGKRSEVRDAHDRYANVEVAYLLQRLEAYEGIALLTSNLRGNIDEAFMRRLDYVLEFPMPEEAERLAIWRRALPQEAPLAPDVDLAFLARKFKLAGGHIRNIALTAAFLAAAEGGVIAMKHLVRATRREHQKLGKLIGEGDFERFRDLLRDGCRPAAVAVGEH